VKGWVRVRLSVRTVCERRGSACRYDHVFDWRFLQVIYPSCHRANSFIRLMLVPGLNEISAELRTVENYTRLLQNAQEELSRSLTESQQRATDLLQCQQLPQTSRAECQSIRQEVTSTRLAIDYLQVTNVEC